LFREFQIKQDIQYKVVATLIIYGNNSITDRVISRR